MRAESAAHAGDPRATVLADLAERIRPVSLAGESRLPVLGGLEPLVAGGGLRRGSTVQVWGPAATSLAFALAAGPSRAGSWTACLQTSTSNALGLVAAAEAGVALERLVLVSVPAESSDRPGERLGATAVAALVDAFDVVLMAGTGLHGAGDQRRVVARARERGAVIVRIGGPGAMMLGSTGYPGPLQRRGPGRTTVADLELRVTATSWEGIGPGHGHLRGRRVTVETSGRGEASRPRRATLWLPSPEGAIEEVVPAASVLPVASGSRTA